MDDDAVGISYLELLVSCHYFRLGLCFCFNLFGKRGLGSRSHCVVRYYGSGSLKLSIGLAGNKFIKLRDFRISSTMDRCCALSAALLLLLFGDGCLSPLYSAIIDLQLASPLRQPVLVGCTYFKRLEVTVMHVYFKDCR